MRRLFFARKGQSITEYAILVSVIIGALIAMQTYVKNSLSAKIKVAADGIHDGQELLYQPKITTSTIVTRQREGVRTVTMDDANIQIDVSGAGSDVEEDTSEVLFRELELNP